MLDKRPRTCQHVVEPHVVEQLLAARVQDVRPAFPRLRLVVLAIVVDL